MRLANLAGRLMVGHPDDGFVDLALASEGRFETESSAGSFGSAR
jgi:hypothetical protein